MKLNNLQKNGLWVISANLIVRSITFGRITCCKLRRAFRFQKMADLLIDRCIKAPPLTHCGMDIFGPFVIQARRSDLKRLCPIHLLYKQGRSDYKLI